MRARAGSAAAAVVAVTIAAACRGEPAARGDTTALRGNGAGAAALTDAHVATLASQLDGAEIGAAQSAEPKLSDARVRDLARTLRADHAAMDSARRLIPVGHEEMQVPPPQFATMHAASQGQSSVLHAMSAGPAFDRAYVASQIAAHGQALDSLRLWRQAVRSDDLGRALDAAAATVQEHLQHARSLQDALGGGADSASMTPPTAPLTPERAETPATPLGRQKPDTATSRLGRPTRPDGARRP